MGGIHPDIDLANAKGSDTVSRVHASLDNTGGSYLLTDLNSTNATRINGKRLEPDKPTPINDGDKLIFGKVAATFKKI
jgi:pSer/pThr/pTyr-binding forkhead associated (FHA) protein